MRLAHDHSKCVIIRDNRWGSRSVRCAHLACRRDKTRGRSAPMVIPASIPESYIDGRASSCRDNRGNQEVSDALTSLAVVIKRGNDSHRWSYQHPREATSAAGPVPVISDNRGNRDDGPCSVPEFGVTTAGMKRCGPHPKSHDESMRLHSSYCGYPCEHEQVN